MIKVESIVDIFEVNGTEVTRDANAAPPSRLIVRSHWNRNSMVELQYGNGPRLAVRAADLEAAIANARNTAKW